MKRRLSEFKRDEHSGIFFAPQREHGSEPFRYTDGAAVEDYMLRAIRQATDVTNGSDELAESAKDWPSYYHLGAGRANIFRALDLPARARILELGCGCGAVTRYLGENYEAVDAVEGSEVRARAARERCRQLDNVRVFVSDFNGLELEPAYDVVVLVGVLEYAPVFFRVETDAVESCLAFLRLAASALKTEGMLVIAIENKIGLKFWSGCPEEHTGRVFSGIEGYPEPDSPLTFSRKELASLLASAGMEKVSFYGCFPDYKFASTVLAPVEGEMSLHLHNWIEVPFATHGTSRDRNFHEGLALKTMFEAGLLQEFANSFLVVASMRPSRNTPEPGWAAKRYSFRRRRPFRCVTTLAVGAEPVVRKERISGETADLTVRNDLMSLTHKVTSCSPWRSGDLLLLEVYRNSFHPEFKEITLNLLEPYVRELMRRYDTGRKDGEGYPLLEGTALDCVLRNLVWYDGVLTPIDEEWGAEVSADYVLYRCVTMEIVASLAHAGRPDLGDPRRLAIELIRHFFPSYGPKRHEKNRELEDGFRDLVVGRTVWTPRPARLQFLRRGWPRRVWYSLPRGARERARKLLD